MSAPLRIRNRKGTSCSHCRAQKRKCDLKSPCTQCVKSHRESECRRVMPLKSIPTSLNHLKFVRIQPGNDSDDHQHSQPVNRAFSRKQPSQMKIKPRVNVQAGAKICELTASSSSPRPSYGNSPLTGLLNTPSAKCLTSSPLYTSLNESLDEPLGKASFSPSSLDGPELLMRDATNIAGLGGSDETKHTLLSPLNMTTLISTGNASLKYEASYASSVSMPMSNTESLTTHESPNEAHMLERSGPYQEQSRVIDQLVFNTLSMFPVQDLLQRVPIVRHESTARPLDPLILDMMKLLPKKEHCDTLVSYFFEVFAHIFCSLHPEWFREKYEAFWQSSIYDVGLGFLSLLFAVIASSGQEISPEKCHAHDMDIKEIRQLPEIWYHQCLVAMDNDTNEDSILHIVTFMVLQSYFHPRKEYKELDRLLRRSIAIARKLDLKRPQPGEDARAKEIRLRVYWGIFNCDTFQGLSLNRSPYMSYDDMCGCPYLTHCNDDDITPERVIVRPLDECTQSSTFYVITKFLFICKELWDDKGNLTSDPVKAIEVDKKLMAYMDNLPWHCKPKRDGTLPTVTKNFSDHYYVLNIFWSCMHTQRFRLHRAHLYPRNEYCYKACIDSAKDVLLVYRAMRRPENAFITKDMFLAISYNVFSAAVAQLFFALVEFPDNHAEYTTDSRNAVEDFKKIKEEGLITSKLVTEGIDVLEKLLDVYDVATGKKAASDLIGFQDYKSNLASNISHLFGGKKVTEQYLNRLSIDFLVAGKDRCIRESSPLTPSDQAISSMFDSSDWNWINGNSFEQWNLDDWQCMFHERISRSQGL